MKGLGNECNWDASGEISKESIKTILIKKNIEKKTEFSVQTHKTYVELHLRHK